MNYLGNIPGTTIHFKCTRRKGVENEKLRHTLKESLVASPSETLVSCCSYYYYYEIGYSLRARTRPRMQSNAGYRKFILNLQFTVQYSRV